MIEVERMSTYTGPEKQVWHAGQDYPEGLEEEVAADLELWAKRYGVHALVKHEPGRIGMTVGGWTFPLRGRLPKMPEGTEPLWGHWFSGEAVGVSASRYRGITAQAMVMKLQRLAADEGWSALVRIYGGNVWACINPRQEMTEVEMHRRIVSATIGVRGRTTYPWSTWDVENVRQEALAGLDFTIPVEFMRRVILNRYAQLGHKCHTEATELGVAFIHSSKELSPEPPALL